MLINNASILSSGFIHYVQVVAVVVDNKDYRNIPHHCHLRYRIVLNAEING
ncbi:hypothetical protein D3C80_1763010 [compost metagenome]